jgi:hypothetical protein
MTQLTITQARRGLLNLPGRACARSDHHAPRSPCARRHAVGVLREHRRSAGCAERSRDGVGAAREQLRLEARPPSQQRGGQQASRVMTDSVRTIKETETANTPRPSLQHAQPKQRGSALARRRAAMSQPFRRPCGYVAPFGTALSCGPNGRTALFLRSPKNSLRRASGCASARAFIFCRSRQAERQRSPAPVSPCGNSSATSFMTTTPSGYGMRSRSCPAPNSPPR